MALDVTLILVLLSFIIGLVTGVRLARPRVLRREF